MGLITRLLSFARRDNHSESTVDPGGGAVLSGEHFSDPGDDSQPLAGDYAVTVSVQRSGGEVCTGYIDTRNAQTAGPGEKRLYSRSAGGSQVAEVWLRNEGTVRVTNGSGSLILSPDGTVNINGVTISPTGVVTVPQSLIVAGDEVASHVHAAGGLRDSGNGPCSGNTASL